MLAATIQVYVSHQIKMCGDFIMQFTLDDACKDTDGSSSAQFVQVISGKIEKGKGG